MADITKTVKFLIVGDASGAAKGFKAVSRGFMNSIKGADTFGKKAKITGIALGGLAATAALAAGAIAVKFGKDSVDAFKRVAAETLKLKRVTGMTAEDASRLGFAFKQTGVDAATGQRSMVLFAKNVVKMSEADKNAKIKAAQHADAIRKQIAALQASGSKSKTYGARMKDLQDKLRDATTASKLNVSAIGELGIKYTDAHGKILPMAQLLPKVADKFAAMPDSAEKTALAMKLFGKSGTAMLPLLNRGAAGMKAFADASDKAGNTLNDKDLQALKDSKQAQRDWDAAMQGLQVTLGRYLLPILTQFATMINSVAIPAFQGMAGWINKHQVLFSTLGNIVRWVWNNALLPMIKFAIVGFAQTGVAVGQVIAAIGHLTGSTDMEAFGNDIQSAAQDTQAWANSLKGIPDDVTPHLGVDDHASAKLKVVQGNIKALHDKIVTAKAKGDDKGLKALEAELAAAEKKKRELHVSVYLDKVNHLSYGLKVSVDGTGAGKLSLRAGGGYTPPGWTLVGERGPELRRDTRATSYLAAARTRQVMSRFNTAAAAGGGGDTYVTVTVQGDTDPVAAAIRIERKLVALKKARRGRALGFQS